MPTKFPAVLFDFNGVIVDDYPLQKEAWNQISLQIRKTEVTDEEMIKQIRGVPTKDTIRRFAANELSANELEQLFLKKEQIIEELFQNSPLFRLNNGLETYLEQLKQHSIAFTIATSSTEAIFKFSFNKLGLNRWFDFDKILFNDGTYPGKPAPEAYIYAARKIGREPNECIVIEDALSGIRSAQAAGVKGIIVMGKDEQLQAFGNLDRVIKTAHDFTELHVSDLI